MQTNTEKHGTNELLFCGEFCLELIIQQKTFYQTDARFFKIRCYDYTLVVFRSFSWIKYTTCSLKVMFHTQI